MENNYSGGCRRKISQNGCGSLFLVLARSVAKLIYDQNSFCPYLCAVASDK